MQFERKDLLSFAYTGSTRLDIVLVDDSVAIKSSGLMYQLE
jgi:hypothetical protein